MTSQIRLHLQAPDGHEFGGTLADLVLKGEERKGVGIVDLLVSKLTGVRRH